MRALAVDRSVRPRCGGRYAAAALCGLLLASVVGVVANATPRTWSSIANLDTNLRDFPMATGQDGRLYAFGGLTGSGIDNTVRIYTPSTNSWSAGAPMPTGRKEHAAVTSSDGRIFVIGGSDSSDTALNTVEAYNPSTDSWESRAPMPTARDRFALATAGGLIYAIGGWRGNSIGETNSVEAYDPVSDTWSPMAPLQTARQLDVAATGPDGKIYAIGGHYVDSVERYDPTTDTWTNAPSMPSGLSAGIAVRGPGGLIYVVGGYSGDTPVSIVETYDAIADRWTVLAQDAAPGGMTEFRARFGGAMGNDGRIYVAGGETRNAPSSNAAEVYEPDGGGPRSSTQPTSLTIMQSQLGLLTISVTGSVRFGFMPSGRTSRTISVGDIQYTNTLQSGANWSAAVAATSLVKGSSVVPFTGMTFTPGPTITPGSGATGTLSPGSGGTFGGADTTPGTTYSSPVSLMTGPASAQGSFTHSGSTASLSTPSGVPAGTYNGTLQYTITG